MARPFDHGSESESETTDAHQLGSLKTSFLVIAIAYPAQYANNTYYALRLSLAVLNRIQLAEMAEYIKVIDRLWFWRLLCSVVWPDHSPK